MDAKINIPRLVTALSSVRRASDPSSMRPEADHVLLQAREDLGLLDVVATDGDTYARVTIPATVMHGGALCLPIRSAWATISLCDDDVARLEGLDRGARLSTAMRTLTFEKALPPAEFPHKLSKRRGSGGVSLVDVPDLASALDIAGRFTCKDESRRNISGVRVEVDGAREALRAIATDGNRLVRVDRDGRGWAPIEGGFTLKPRATECLRSILSGMGVDEAQCLVELGDLGKGRHWIRFTHPDDAYEVASELINEPYPPYEKVIPSSYERFIHIGRFALWSAASYMADIMGESVARGARFTVHPDRLDFDLPSGGPPGIGDATSTVPLKKPYEGESIAIGINPKLLAELIQAMSSEDVTLGFSDELEPVTIAPAGDDRHIAVLMPMRV